MLMTRVCDIVQVETALPPCEHGLVVVCPGTCPPHRLKTVNPHYWRQATVVTFGEGYGASAVVHHVAVVALQSLHQFLGSHEHGAVFVPHGETDCSRLVLKMDEIFRAMSAIDTTLVTIIVDVPPVAHVGSTGSLGKRFGEGFRRVTPWSIG